MPTPAESAPERPHRSFASAEDVAAFAATLGRFERGEIGADEWRAFRLVNGTYPQRQDEDAQMLRVKVPQGVLDAGQLEALAEAAERWSRGFAHVTTRQNVQMHFLTLRGVEEAMALLAGAGLTTKEACGNAVRNVTACPFAGVARDEAFDVTPYAEALTRHFLRRPLASRLPRKFKVAFEGCPDDHAFAAINDIGFRARVGEGGERGFRVTVGGGTALLCASGGALVDFLPVAETLSLAEAIVRAYARLGDYEHRKRNRLKYLVRALGGDGWKAAVEGELEAVRAEGGIPLPFDPESPPVEGPPAPGDPAEAEAVGVPASGPPRGPGIVPSVRVLLDPGESDRRRWTATNVRPQRQEGFSIAAVTLPLGDVTSGQLRALAVLSRAHGDGTVRTTHDQNVVLRWVRDPDLAALHRGLAAAGLAAEGASTLADVTSCPGAETCRVAVTHSRGVGRLVADRLAARPEVVAAAGALDVKVSGCPNGCGQHHVAGVGLQGSVRQVGGRALPQYFVSVGGGLAADGARFGRLVAKVPARRAPEAVERLALHAAAEKRGDETTLAYLQRADAAALKALLADLEAFDPGSAGEEDFVDPGS